jgi:hypothetical protein
MKDFQGRYQSLTPREPEVMKRVINGLLNKQIAAQLGTTELIPRRVCISTGKSQSRRPGPVRTLTDNEQAVTSKIPLEKQLRPQGASLPERCVQVVIRTTADVRGS